MSYQEQGGLIGPKKSREPFRNSFPDAKWVEMNSADDGSPDVKIEGSWGWDLMEVEDHLWE